MNEKLMHWLVLGGFLLLSAIIFFNLGEKNIVVSNEGAPRIMVTGIAEDDVMPDQAVLSLTIMTEGKEATLVQDENTQKTAVVMKALKEAGVKESEIETRTYNLYPWQEWDGITQKVVDKGYRLQHTLVVTTPEIKSVGKILDRAVKSGVNTVDGVQFTLSDTTEQKLKQALVAEASMKAKQKAEDLAASLGVSVGDVLSVSENGYAPPIYYAAYGKAEADADAVPSLSPQSVKVSLSVNVEYGIEQ